MSRQAHASEDCLDNILDSGRYPRIPLTGALFDFARPYILCSFGLYDTDATAEAQKIEDMAVFHDYLHYQTLEMLLPLLLCLLGENVSLIALHNFLVRKRKVNERLVLKDDDGPFYDCSISPFEPELAVRLDSGVSINYRFFAEGLALVEQFRSPEVPSDVQKAFYDYHFKGDRKLKNAEYLRAFQIFDGLRERLAKEGRLQRSFLNTVADVVNIGMLKNDGYQKQRRFLAGCTLGKVSNDELRQLLENGLEVCVQLE